MVATETAENKPVKVCAFAPCTCPVDDKVDHCGPTCRLGIGERAEPCKCGHAQCQASIGES
jgi:hypothetical protein